MKKEKEKKGPADMTEAELEYELDECRKYNPLDMVTIIFACASIVFSIVSIVISVNSSCLCKFVMVFISIIALAVYIALVYCIMHTYNKDKDYRLQLYKRKYPNSKNEGEDKKKGDEKKDDKKTGDCNK